MPIYLGNNRLTATGGGGGGGQTNTYAAFQVHPAIGYRYQFFRSQFTQAPTYASLISFDGTNVIGLDRSTANPLLFLSDGTFLGSIDPTNLGNNTYRVTEIHGTIPTGNFPVDVFLINWNSSRLPVIGGGQITPGFDVWNGIYNHPDGGVYLQTGRFARQADYPNASVTAVDTSWVNEYTFPDGEDVFDLLLDTVDTDGTNLIVTRFRDTSIPAGRIDGGDARSRKGIAWVNNTGITATQSIIATRYAIPTTGNELTVVSRQSFNDTVFSRFQFHSSATPTTYRILDVKFSRHANNGAGGFWIIYGADGGASNEFGTQSQVRGIVTTADLSVPNSTGRYNRAAATGSNINMGSDFTALNVNNVATASQSGDFTRVSVIINPTDETNSFLMARGNSQVVDIWNAFAAGGRANFGRYNFGIYGSGTYRYLLPNPYFNDDASEIFTQELLESRARTNTTPFTINTGRATFTDINTALTTSDRLNPLNRSTAGAAQTSWNSTFFNGRHYSVATTGSQTQGQNTIISHTRDNDVDQTSVFLVGDGTVKRPNDRAGTAPATDQQLPGISGSFDGRNPDGGTSQLAHGIFLRIG